MPNKSKPHMEAKIKILHALSMGRSKAEAAREADIGRRTLYDLIDRDPAFRAEVEYAIKTYQEDLLGRAEKELERRAFWTEDPDKKSHIMLIFMLKKLDPNYKENYKTEKKVTHAHVNEVEIDAEDLEKGMAILMAAKNDQKAGDEEVGS